MIITETVTINDQEFLHIYSSQNFVIRKVGTDEEYTDVYDLLGAGYTYEETEIPIEEGEEEELKLTRGDVFRGLLLAKNITKAQIRALIEAMPETTDEEKLAKGLAFIDFDDALYFYRRNLLINKLGAQLNISAQQMTDFFSTKDWHALID